MDDVDVTVVLPAYNEAGHILNEIERINAAFAASPYTHEILLIDDGSTDETATIVAGASHVRFVRFNSNRGSGASRRYGTQHARAPIVAWTDADMSYPNERLPDLVAELERSGANQIVGARRTEEGTHKWARIPAKWVIRRIAESLSRSSIPDLNSNDQAGIAPVVVEPEIIELLELSKEYYEQTKGHVNVAFGAVLSIWHDFREEGIENPEKAKLPSMKDLQEANQHTNIEDVIIDKEANTVYLKDSKMSLDVGAIAKGFGVELVAKKLLEQSQDPHLLFSIGGNIRALGHKPDDENWIIGIQNPDLTSSEAVIVRVSLIDGSLVTSGGYQRYYTVNGKEYHHIINRDTLMPSDYFASVSVLAEDSALADAYSTALFNMSYEDGLELIDSTEGVEALWIFPNQTMEMTRGFAKRMILN